MTAHFNDLDDDDLDDVIDLPIVKVGRPRVLKQRKAYKQQSHALFEPADGAPTESWWLGITDRDEFRRRAAEQFDRMQKSKFGKRSGVVTENPL